MKKFISILAVVGSLSFLFALLPVSAAESVSKVPEADQIADASVVEQLAAQGIDADYVQKIKDYDDKNHYAEIWQDKKSGKEIAIISQLPMSTATGEKIDCRWILDGSVYRSAINLFNASVSGLTISITAGNDQPSGKKAGDGLTYTPTLTIGGKVVSLTGKARIPSLLATDPLNPNYTNNTLVWDYGICKRYLRIIEGQLQGYWIFASNPNADVQIDYICSGVLTLNLGQFATDKDTELVSKTAFDTGSYPFTIGDSLTFYPDAHVETTTVDGEVTHTGDDSTWATIRDGAGTGHDDSSISMIVMMQTGDVTENSWDNMNRIIVLFDVSSLPDDYSSIDSATLSLYGYGKINGWTPDIASTINIYSSAPASNNDLVNGDYDSLGTTAYSTAITYASFNTAGYNDFALNATGVSALETAIAGDNIFKTGAREAAFDAANSPPTWEANASVQYQIRTAEKGEGFKPKLVVVYTPATSQPTVTTQAASSVEDTTATGNGNITVTGGDNADQRGIVWDTSTHGAPGDVAPAASGYANDIHEHGDYGVGAFTIALTGLPTGTTIYCRAYAHNDNGYGYGDEVSFLTKPAAPTNVAATDGTYTDKVTITWTKSTGATGYKVYEGANLLDTLGDVATYDDSAAPASVITPGTAAASDGTYATYVQLSLSGESIANGASRTYKVVAFNATGDSADSSTDTGYRGHGTLTYQWQRSAADSDADYSNIGGATTNPYNDTSAPADGSGRYFKCVLSATGASNQTSTADRGYRDTFDVPTVATNIYEGYGGTWIILSGTILDEGDGEVTEVGFNYGETTGYGSKETKTGTWHTGDTFTMYISGLSRATVWHYQAIASNSGGEGQGNDRIVSTTGSPAIYEYINENGDGDSGHIYGNAWADQYFLVGNTSHTSTSVVLYLKRSGSPGTITVSIRHANGSGLPTGADIASATIDGDAISTSYLGYEFSWDELSLEAANGYCIVVRATNGDASNYVLWQKDTGGNGDNVNDFAGTSADAGVTWSTASPTDYLFEVWGYGCINIISGGVYSGYLEEGDMLFLMLYRNIYPPYYPNTIASHYFYLQLLDDDGVTVITQTPLLQWGYMPGSIYLSAGACAGLTWGENYYIRIYGDFSGNPVASYQLTSDDWLVKSPTYLASWIISTAHTIEDYYTDLTGSIVTWTTSGNLLNAAGATKFCIGIPYLSVVMPEILESAVLEPGSPDYTPTDTLSGQTTWQEQVGPQVEEIAEDASIIFGWDAKTIIAIVLLIFYIGIAILVVNKGSSRGSVVAALALSFPFIIAGGMLRVVDFSIIMIIGIVALLLTAASLWWWRT